MKRLKCTNCLGEWYVEDNYLNRLKFCPYCAEIIRKKNKNIEPDTLGKAISKVVDRLGIEVFSKPEQLSGYLYDIAPKLSKEIRIFSKIFGKEYLGMIKSAFEQDTREAEQMLQKMEHLLVENDAVDKQWANMMCKNCMEAIQYAKGIGIAEIMTAEVMEIADKNKGDLQRTFLEEKKAKENQKLTVRGTVVAVGYNSYGQCNVTDWKDIVSISCGARHTIGLKKDGTVVAAGDNNFKQCNISNWKDIVSISCGSWHTIGLKRDGTVVAVGNNHKGQCYVDSWRDIAAIYGVGYSTVGVRKDGTVMSVDWKMKKITDWKEILSVTGDVYGIVALKKDGTVIEIDGSPWLDEVNNWKDIVSVSCRYRHVIGLKKDGTVVAVRPNGDVKSWKNMISVSCGCISMVGLRKDGTVVVEGDNQYGSYDARNWGDIVSISCGEYHVVGLK